MTLWASTMRIGKLVSEIGRRAMPLVIVGERLPLPLHSVAVLPR